MKRTWRSYAIILLIAVFLRGWAVIMLPEDYDESTYLQNGFDYASRIRAGDLDGVIDYFGNYEHPPLVKLVYAGGVLLLGDSASWTHAFYFSRMISAVFGVLAVALMVALDPLAGGMLALHTLAVKYTSQVYLDAIASALILAAILAFLRFTRNDGKRWLWLSAVALGISAASKYTYMPVAIMVIGYLGIFEKKIPWTWLAGYAAVALATFFVLDVHLWHDPFNRLLQSFSFHLQYSQSAHVQQVAYPWYQPFIWIFTSAPARWHPRVFFYHGFDGAIALLAVAGLRREWKTRRWLVVWLVFGVMFLLLWPTKWPQYALTVTPALCIIGAGTLRRVWNWLRTQEAYWGYVKNYIPAPGKWFWWALSIFLVFVLGIYLSAWGRLAIGRIGWSHMTAQNSDLPSNMVNDILQIDQARILIATDQGAAIYTQSMTTDQQGQWTLLNCRNSGLLNDDIRSLANDRFGGFWFGTADGLSRTQDFTTWTHFTAFDLHQASANIMALAAAEDGRVFAGTLSGASVWDGQRWESIPFVEGQAVFALAAAGDSLLFGTASGVGRLGPGNNWTLYPTQSAVKHILVDSTGAIWAATTGDGLAKLDGNQWQYFTSASSDLPLNLVSYVYEPEPGVLWLGVSPASMAGGELVILDGSKWSTLDTENSGYSGAEPRVIFRSADSQVWIGTTNRGIDIYRLGE